MQIIDTDEVGIGDATEIITEKGSIKGGIK